MHSRARRLSAAAGLLGVAILWAPSATAAPGGSAAPRDSFPSSTRNADLSAWLRRHTDLPPKRVLIDGPLAIAVLPRPGSTGAGGTPMSVRTEVLDATWGQRSGYLSAQTEAVFDCAGRRYKALSGSVYPHHRRIGEGRPVAGSDDWIAASGGPAARVLSAVCDPGFSWPLATPPAETEAPPSNDGFKVQVAVANTPAEARVAIGRAQGVLAGSQAGLVFQVEPKVVSGRLRYRSVIGGFANPRAALEACAQLRARQQACFVRR
jgi:hypothetical protein